MVNSRWCWLYAEASCSSELRHRHFVVGGIWLAFHVSICSIADISASTNGVVC
jgi:hypothetical protein